MIRYNMFSGHLPFRTNWGEKSQTGISRKIFLKSLLKCDWLSNREDLKFTIMCSRHICIFESNNRLEYTLKANTFVTKIIKQKYNFMLYASYAYQWVYVWLSFTEIIRSSKYTNLFWAGNKVGWSQSSDPLYKIELIKRLGYKTASVSTISIICRRQDKHNTIYFRIYKGFFMVFWFGCVLNPLFFRRFGILLFFYIICL